MQDAVLDANVLYPAPLRDFFMRLAVKLYQPKWTDKIHEEWIRNVLKDRPDLTLAQLTRTRELMNRHGGTCLVTGYEAWWFWFTAGIDALHFCLSDLSSKSLTSKLGARHLQASVISSASSSMSMAGSRA